MTSERPWQPLGWFLFWLVVLSAPVDALAVHIGSSPPMLSRISMWTPGLAAIITTLQLRLSFASLGLQLPTWRYLTLGYITPWVVVAVVVATRGERRATLARW